MSLSHTHLAVSEGQWCIEELHNVVISLGVNVSSERHELISSLDQVIMSPGERERWKTPVAVSLPHKDPSILSASKCQG